MNTDLKQHLVSIVALTSIALPSVASAATPVDSTFRRIDTFLTTHAGSGPIVKNTGEQATVSPERTREALAVLRAER